MLHSSTDCIQCFFFLIILFPHGWIWMFMLIWHFFYMGQRIGCLPDESDVSYLSVKTSKKIMKVGFSCSLLSSIGFNKTVTWLGIHIPTIVFACLSSFQSGAEKKKKRLSIITKLYQNYQGKNLEEIMFIKEILARMLELDWMTKMTKQ